MQSSSRLPETSFRLSESLHHQLDLYALAASAAGVGAMALTQPAEAKIIYTKVHQVIGPKSSYKLDLNHDGVTDFTLTRRSNCRTSSCYYLFGQTPTRGNAAMGYWHRSGWRFDYALQPGSRIGAGAHFMATAAGFVDVVQTFGAGSTFTVGPWANATNRYVGLVFQIKGKTHYGWARMTVKVNRPTITSTLTGYAYETTPNKAIIAGKTKGADVIPIQPASLGRLARGSVGLSRGSTGKN